MEDDGRTLAPPNGWLKQVETPKNNGIYHLSPGDSEFATMVCLILGFLEAPEMAQQRPQGDGPNLPTDLGFWSLGWTGQWWITEFWYLDDFTIVSICQEQSPYYITLPSGND